ncbi:MAG: hypothetical protein NTV28_02100 [Propionibacteriales bacterium]|nr:hypothetical protein [Propionibacteriales bacterium]
MDEPMEIRVMWDYGAGECLWGDEGGTDGEEFGLSDGLRRDLRAFGDRCEANVPPQVYDDRWTGVFLMQTWVRWKYAISDLRTGAARQRRRDFEELRRVGEDLARRVQEEVGPAYVVRYQH